MFYLLRRRGTSAALKQQVCAEESIARQGIQLSTRQLNHQANQTRGGKLSPPAGTLIDDGASSRRVGIRLGVRRPIRLGRRSLDLPFVTTTVREERTNSARKRNRRLVRLSLSFARHGRARDGGHVRGRCVSVRNARRVDAVLDVVYGVLRRVFVFDCVACARARTHGLKQCST